MRVFLVPRDWCQVIKVWTTKCNIEGIRKTLHDHYLGIWEGFANPYLGGVIYKPLSHALVVLKEGFSNPLRITFNDPLLHKLTSIRWDLENSYPNIALIILISFILLNHCQVFSSCGFEFELVREYPHFQFKLPRVRWNLPDFVPSCLLTQLKTICITGLMGMPHEMEVANFLLENGRVRTQARLNFPKM